jgi:hypothetical protein
MTTTTLQPITVYCPVRGYGDFTLEHPLSSAMRAFVRKMNAALVTEEEA